MRIVSFCLTCLLLLGASAASAAILDAWKPLSQLEEQESKISNEQEARAAQTRAHKKAGLMSAQIAELQELAKAAETAEAKTAYADLITAFTLAQDGFTKAADLYAMAADQYSKGDAEGAALNALMGQSSENCADEVTDSGKIALGSAAAQQYASASTQANQAAEQCKLCMAVAEGADDETAAGITGAGTTPTPAPLPSPTPTPASGS